MSLILPNIHTNNPSYPIYTVSADEIALAGMSDILVWLKADGGYFSIDKSTWYDALTGNPYSITGVLNNEGLINNKPAVQFTGTQKVYLGNNFPVGKNDYSIATVLNPTSFSAPGVSVLLGSNGASYHAINFDTSGRLGFIHNAAPSPGAVVHNTGVPILVVATYNASASTADIYINGTFERTATGMLNQSDPSMVMADVPGLAGDRKLRGLISEQMVFARDLSKLLPGQTVSDLSVLHTWLKTKYSL